jgi:hypothetical protein
MEVEGDRQRGRPRKTWMKSLEDDMTRCALSPVVQRIIMEREDPWCKTANPGKSGHNIGVITNGSTVKPTCVCYISGLDSTHNDLIGIVILY